MSSPPAPAPGLTRRRLLAYGSAALAAGLLPRPVRGVGASGRQRIAVVGAGLAGLSAAFELVEAGHEVTVFEARPRAGGRVRTVREPFADGLYAEAGAAAILSHHDLTRHYAARFELPLAPFATGSGEAVSLMRGRRIVGGLVEAAGLPVVLTAEERALGLQGMHERYWGREIAAGVAAGPADTPGWPGEELRHLDGMSLADLWRGHGASEGAVAVLRFGYLDMVGEGVDSIDALFQVREAAYRRLSTGADRIEGGNDRLPLAFAERLRDRIHYGAEAIALTHGPDEVRLAVRDGSGSQVVTADRVVFAVPFAVLREVAIAPELSPEKARAIRGLRHTSVTRSFLQCRRRCWEAAGLSGNAMTDLEAMRVYPVSHGGSTPRGLLESFSVGAGARRLAAMPLAERLAFVVGQTDAALPGVAAEFEGGASVVWDDELWARGAYPWFEPGEQIAFLPHAARPEGRVHFAGDQTSPWPGWMQGALHSGRRVAAEIGHA